MSKQAPQQISDVSVREEQILARWNERAIFEKSLERSRQTALSAGGAGPFVYYDGPPFATGMPHFGHLLPTSLKDAIPRYRTMRGFYVERQWGWDCHGLPIENLIQKELELPTKKDIEAYGVEKFAEAAQASVTRFEKEWQTIIPRAGRWVDMKRAYKTLDPYFTESGWWAFAELHKKGLVYEGFRVMHVSPLLETALSNMEVAQNYKDITDLSAYVRFALTSEDDAFSGASCIAWTTTPWTLPGNVALAVHPELKYVRIHRTEADEDIVIVASRIEALSKHIGEYEEVWTKKGSELVGLSYEPVYSNYKERPDLAQKENGWKIYPGYFVTDDSGTGIVHIAPAFGEDDLVLGTLHSLPFVQHVGMNGEIKADIPEFAGHQAKPKDDSSATDVLVIKDLAKRGALFAKEKIVHAYPHCWRTDAPLLNYAMSSWFIKVSEYRDRMVELNNGIHWTPSDIGEGRFGKWLEHARDWSVSRSRYWGAPLPIWKNADGSKVEFIGSLEQLKEKTRGTARYYTIRHAQSKSNVADVVSSLPGTDDTLTELGVQQAREAAEMLTKDGAHITHIYVSDMTRAKETAEVLRSACCIPESNVVVDVRLREIQAGKLNGGTWDEFHEYLDSVSYEERYTHRLPDGESYEDVKKRAAECMFEIDARHRDTQDGVLIVAHGAVLGLLHAAAQPVQENKMWETYVAGTYNHGNAEVKELAFAPYPHDAEFRLDMHRPYIDTITWKNTEGEVMQRIPDVFDTWFDSGSVPFAKWHYPFEKTLEFEAIDSPLFPADYIAEGLDQTRGWFYSMLALATPLFDRAPYKNVVVNGLVLAEDGQKMSKSKNNFPPVIETIATYSVDALRYFLLASPAVKAEDVAFSVRGVDEVQKKIIGRLRNVVSFYEMYANDVDKALTIEACRIAAWESTNVLDQWILARLAQDEHEITTAMEEYRIDRAVRPFALFVDDISTWYLRRSRERCKEDGEDRDLAMATLRFVLATTAKLLAPYMPFLAEDIYLRVTHEQEEESVHLETWPSLESFEEDGVLEAMAQAREVVSLGLEARAQAGVKVRQPLAKLEISQLKYPKLAQSQYAQIIADELNVKEVVLGATESVALDTTITDTLKHEGWVREVTRAVQGARKEAGLLPDDRITLSCVATSDLEAALKQHEAALVKTIGAHEVRYTAFDDSVTPRATGELDLDDESLTFAFHTS